MAAPSAPVGCGATAASDLMELLRRLRSLGILPNTVGDGRYPQLSSAFNRVLSLFFSQVLHQNPPTLPVALGDGTPLDLFSLYAAARRHSNNWTRVTSALSLRHPGAPAAVKLVYSKYLQFFHRWISFVLDRRDDDASQQCDGSVKIDCLLSPSNPKPKLEDDGPLEAHEVAIEKEPEPVGDAKIKKADLLGMLRWVREAARGRWTSSEKDGAKVESAEEFRLLLLTRKAMVVKRSVRIGLGSLLSQKGHPSMYDDFSSPLCGDENLRHSRRIHHKQSGDDLEDAASFKRHKSNSSGELFENYSREGSPEEQDPSPKRRVKVPPWDENSTIRARSDSKWLGTRIWPPESKEGRVSSDGGSVGKGRQDSCTCDLPGSIDCVRFHVAENRLILKRSLKKTFYDWKFQQMGEEISLSWTAEEEEKFKSIVYRKSQSSSDKNFWEQLFGNFPNKSRRGIVSYYFNVFLLRRRGYQNRVTPTSIDSDDEEGAFGFLSSHLGENAVKYHQSQGVICTQNTQCIDFDE